MQFIFFFPLEDVIAHKFSAALLKRGMPFLTAFRGSELLSASARVRCQDAQGSCSLYFEMLKECENH